MPILNILSKRMLKQFTYLNSDTSSFILGLGFTVSIAAFATALANLPGLNKFGPMLCAIFIAVLYRIFGATRSNAAQASSLLPKKSCALLLFSMAFA